MASLINALRRPSTTNEPPTVAEQRRNDLLVVVVVVVAVLLALGVRALATGARAEFSLGTNLPTIRYPASWLVEQGAEGVLLRALDLTSTSTFDARLEVFARDLRPAESLETITASWPLSRSRQYEKYRILGSEPVPTAGGEVALLSTYAYIADPTRESGMAGLPVVVKAQDLLFVANDGVSDRLIVATVAADATEWDVHAHGFQRIYEDLLNARFTGGGQAGNVEEGGE
jgi:hypothetical protein